MKVINNFSNLSKGIIIIEVQCMIPERFINLLWKQGVYIKNIRRTDITTLIMEIRLKDYYLIEAAAKKTKAKIRILNRKGIAFFILKAKRRIALFGGVLIFAGLIYYLSTFIWNIEIVTEHTLSPYELREQFKNLGIQVGINKSKLNVYQLEESIIKNNDNIMWIKARVEGTKLKVNVAERVNPPTIISDNTPCNLAARRDGQIVRIYTTAGTALVKPGDIVKAGQTVVKGEQGKEGSVYSVHAKGEVIARTFYEETKVVPTIETKREKTGRYNENIYIRILGKKIYIKKSLNNYGNYDKIIDNKFIFQKEIVYEVMEKRVTLDAKKVIEGVIEELTSKITVNLDKSVKVVDKITDTEPSNDSLKVRVAVIGEENIAVDQPIGQ